MQNLNMAALTNKSMGVRLLGVTFGLFIIFTSSNLSLIIWNNLYCYYLSIALGGFVFGGIIIKIEKALMIFLLTFTAAFLTSLLLVVAPSYMIGAEEDVNILIAFITSLLSKHILISFPMCIIVGLLGCFVGGRLKGESAT